MNNLLMDKKYKLIIKNLRRQGFSEIEITQKINLMAGGKTARIANTTWVFNAFIPKAKRIIIQALYGSRFKFENEVKVKFLEKLVKKLGV